MTEIFAPDVLRVLVAPFGLANAYLLRDGLLALDPHVVAFGHGQPLRNPAEIERALG